MKFYIIFLTLLLIPLVSASLMKSDEWRIVKTGAEEYLDVNYRAINTTATQFCLRATNFNAFQSERTRRGQLGTQMPVEKRRNANSFSVNTDRIDPLKMAVHGECFIVSHEESFDISFRVGLNSIEITGSGSTYATAYPWKGHIAKNSSGHLFVSYYDGQGDIWLAESADDGLNWSNTEVVNVGSGRYRPGVMVDSNDNVILYFDSSSYVLWSNSTNYSNERTLIYESGAQIKWVACAMDSNDIFHCVAIDENADRSVYLNSTLAYGDFEIVNNNTNDDSDYCDIAVDINNKPWVICAGSDHDDMDIWSPALNGWGDTNRRSIHNSTDINWPGIYIGVDNTMYVTWEDASDLWVAISTDNATTWNVTEIDTSASQFPAIYSNEEELFVLYQGATTTSGYAYYAQGDTDNTNWDVRNAIQSNSGYTSAQAELYPAFNRFKETLYYVWTDNGADVNFHKMRVNYSTWCPQYLPNVSNDCGALSTGAYTFTGAGCANTDNVMDNDWSTKGSGGSSCNLWLNYTIPADNQNADLEYQAKTLSSVFKVYCYNHSSSSYLELDSYGNSLDWRTTNTVVPDDCLSTTLRLWYEYDTVGQAAEMYDQKVWWNITPAECTPNITNTSWSAWSNVSCLVNDTMNESRSLTQYDANNCGAANTTFYEYLYNKTCNYCSYDITNTSWSAWSNVGCLVNDTMNRSRSLTEYDANYSTCYAVTGLAADLWNSGSNNTHYEYIWNTSCNYCSYNNINSSWGAITNYSCLVTDFMNQSHSRSEYDDNYSTCYAVTGLASDLFNGGSNITHTEYFANASCNYCSYNVVNSSWSVWSNLSCLVNDTMNRTRSRTEYDDNYSTCYAVTGIASDLWNSGSNNTYNEYVWNTTCNYCSYNNVNSSWGAITNYSCLITDFRNQSHSRTEYDDNYSTCYAVTGIASDLFNGGSNITHTEYFANASCNYCSYNNVNSSWGAITNYSCLTTDFRNQSHSRTEYDDNYSTCYAVTGIASDLFNGGSNITHTEYFANASCNYCSYNVVNSSWSVWSNLSCLVNDTMNRSRSLTEYDDNYSTCYGVTGLAADLWNSGSNNTYYEYVWNITCNYCSYNPTNTSWTAWRNLTCLASSTMNQSSNCTEYDSNYSTCYGVTGLASDLWNSGVNLTHLKFQNISACSYGVSTPTVTPAGAASNAFVPDDSCAFNPRNMSFYEYVGFIIANYFLYSLLFIIFIVFIVHKVGEITK